MIKVKNANGSSRFRIPLGYDSWLDYWEKQTGAKMSICGCKIATTQILLADML